ncbi:hypothetical protein LWI29_033317 [Acer saccharum]|uniref:Uncharacterized protein n=1 Tax=Acer saccharum TaxID=4024 RepID=A0AA39SFM5_ACESA|nr:hypothetical protein LWI29_033317 [Acer saccharum]
MMLELGRFPNLLVFNVSNNSFTGMLNSQTWSASNGTEILDLLMNHFVGNLGSLENCSSSLKELHLDVNSLPGSLPGELPNVFGNLTNLEFFIANSNSFSGSLPLSLGLCSKLHVLDLQNNSLTGSIDLNFTRMNSLCTLNLAGNHFSGPLRNSLADCHQLKILSLAKNGFAGQIPFVSVEVLKLF